MDQVLEEAQKRRQVLVQQNEANAREIAELDQFIRKYQELKLTKDGLLAERGELMRWLKEPASSAKEKILTNVGHMLSDGSTRRLRYIMTELRKRGIEVGGKSELNKLLNLSSMLSRNGQFESAGRKLGWRLAKRLPKGEGHE
jgi:hypothetical protein